MVDFVFFMVSDVVIIIFDVIEGIGGLVNCVCDVYLYMGVIIVVSIGLFDW